MRDVSRAAQVSVCTASQALRGVGRLSEATREKVRKAASTLGYKNDPLLAGALSRARRRGAQKTGGAFGVLVTTQPPGALGTSEGRACLEGIKACANAHGYQIDLFFPDRDYSENPDRLRSVIRARGLDGLIFIENVHSIYLGALTSQLFFEGSEELPVVFAGRSEIPETSAWHVGFDRFASGFVCMEYALETGSRRPGLLNSIGRISVNDEFAAGCRKAQERFLPSSQIPPVCILDSADPDRHQYLADWVLREGIDRIITNSRVLKLRESKGGIWVEGVPLIHGEMRVGELQEMAGVEVDWKNIGILATETLFGRLQQNQWTGQSHGARLLAPGRLRRTEGPLILGPERWKPCDLSPWLNGQVNTPGDWFGTFPLPLRGEDALHGAPVPFPLSSREEPGLIGAIYFRSTSQVAGIPPGERPVKLKMPIPERAMPARRLHLLLGCGFAESGGKAGRIEVYDAMGGKIASQPLIAGGRPHLVRGANIQDWWPHYPLLGNAVPVYHPKDRAYHGYLYAIAVEIPEGCWPACWVVHSNASSAVSLALLAAGLEYG